MKPQFTLLQCCSICGSSWRGQSFRYIYTQADKQAVALRIKELQEENEKREQPLTDKELQKQYPKLTPAAIIEQAAAQHPMKNQSRLMMSEDGKYLVCPDCHTAYELDDFKDAKYLKGTEDNG